MKTRLPYSNIELNNLFIQFRQLNGVPLNYIRFEHADTGQYLGAIDVKNKKDLTRLKKAIDYLLKESE